MAKTQTMSVSELEKLVNGSVALRNINKHKVEEYAERMKAGVEFPPVIIGRYPHSEKYGSQAIVDGIHRLTAAQAADIKTLAYTEIVYNTLAEMLADMYVRNMAHGLPVTEGQRNARIKLLRDQGMTLEVIAKQFGLGKSSIDRIVKGQQGEGKSGRKGASASKGQKSQKPKKASGILRMIETLNGEFERKRPNQIAELVAYLSPSTEEEPEGEVDSDKLEEVTTLYAYLNEVIKMVKQ